MIQISRLQISISAPESPIQMGDAITIKLTFITSTQDALYKIFKNRDFRDAALHITFRDIDTGKTVKYTIAELKDKIRSVEKKDSDKVIVQIGLLSDDLIKQGFGGKVEVTADFTISYVKGRRIIFTEQKTGKPIPNVIVEFRGKTYHSNIQGIVDIDTLPPGTSWLAQWSYIAPGHGGGGWTPPGGTTITAAGSVISGVINIHDEGIYRVTINLGGVIPI